MRGAPHKDSEAQLPSKREGGDFGTVFGIRLKADAGTNAKGTDSH